MKFIRFPLWVVVCLIIMSAPAHAYLDPGSGSALLQGILAALAALGVALKLYWHRLLVFLGLRKRPEDTKDSQASSQSANTEQKE